MSPVSCGGGGTPSTTPARRPPLLQCVRHWSSAFQLLRRRAGDLRLALLERAAPVTLDDGRLWPEISGKYWAGDIRHCFAAVSEARRVLRYALQHFGGRTAGDRGLAGRSGGPRPYRRSGRGPGEKGSDSMNHLQGPILITGGAGYSGAAAVRGGRHGFGGSADPSDHWIAAGPSEAKATARPMPEFAPRMSATQPLSFSLPISVVLAVVGAGVHLLFVAGQRDRVGAGGRPQFLDLRGLRF